MRNDRESEVICMDSRLRGNDNNWRRTGLAGRVGGGRLLQFEYKFRNDREREAICMDSRLRRNDKEV